MGGLMVKIPSLNSLEDSLNDTPGIGLLLSVIASLLTRLLTGEISDIFVTLLFGIFKTCVDISCYSETNVITRYAPKDDSSVWGISVTER